MNGICSSKPDCINDNFVLNRNINNYYYAYSIDNIMGCKYCKGKYETYGTENKIL